MHVFSHQIFVLPAPGNTKWECVYLLFGDGIEKEKEGKEESGKEQGPERKNREMKEMSTQLNIHSWFHHGLHYNQGHVNHIECFLLDQHFLNSLSFGNFIWLISYSDCNEQIDYFYVP